MKGHIQLTSGQHYVSIDGQTTWRWQGWHHPLIAPIGEYSVQVHHFKWDETCMDRIRDVANTNKEYASSEEYRKMYREIAKSRFVIDIQNEDYMFEDIGDDYNGYSQWKNLLNKIVAI
jgi:hypothetical protein